MLWPRAPAAAARKVLVAGGLVASPAAAAAAAVAMPAVLRLLCRRVLDLVNELVQRLSAVGNGGQGRDEDAVVDLLRSNKRERRVGRGDGIEGALDLEARSKG